MSEVSSAAVASIDIWVQASDMHLRVKNAVRYRPGYLDALARMHVLLRMQHHVAPFVSDPACVFAPDLWTQVVNL